MTNQLLVAQEFHRCIYRLTLHIVDILSFTRFALHPFCCEVFIIIYSNDAFSTVRMSIVGKINCQLRGMEYAGEIRPDVAKGRL